MTAATRSAPAGAGVASGGLLTSRAPAFSPAASTLLLPTPQVRAPHRATMLRRRRKLVFSAIEHQRPAGVRGRSPVRVRAAALRLH